MANPNASTTSTSKSSSDESHKPSIVGNAFVKQYYHLLSKTPDMLHRFYKDDSQFSHGSGSEQTVPISGQKEINEKIMSLGYAGAKVDLENGSIVCQTSLSEGVLVMVTGSISLRERDPETKELTTKVLPPKNFCQTFFLAVQPKGYFVLNDSFRFLNSNVETSIVPALVSPTKENISPPSPSTSPSPSPSGQCAISAGHNNDGTNLKSSADITSSAGDCCDRCASADGCVGYTWVHENKECWLKSSVDAPRDDDCGGCVTSGTFKRPSPVPTPPSPVPPSPSPSPGPVPGCPGGSLAACISICPDDDPAVFQTCVHECTDRCGGGSSCTGGDDGSDVASCMANCPSEGFSDCITCCTNKFPSFI